MEELFNLGIMEDELNDMIMICPSIRDLEDEEIISKIKILEYIGCNERDIKNIILTNPHYLDRINSDIIKLINRLKELKFSTLYLLLEANPYILNLDVFEIDEYIDKRIENGELLEDIVEELEIKPYLFNEI